MKILVPELTTANLGIPQSSSKRWEASLLLEFTKSSSSKKTLLSRREHFGPLMIQKALYPEGDEICHAVVLHPPAGIAGGDHLHIEIHTLSDSKAVVTTPGATKWYKSNGLDASQVIHLHVEYGAHLDFLPQENIFSGLLANGRTTAHASALLVAGKGLFDSFAVKAVMATKFAIFSGDNRTHQIGRYIRNWRPVPCCTIAVKQHGQRCGNRDHGIDRGKRDAAAREIKSRFEAGTKETGGKRALGFCHAQKLAQCLSPVTCF